MTDITIRVFDTETSGIEATDEVIEIGAVDLDCRDQSIKVFAEMLAKPSKPITPEAMAIHHITNEEVAAAKEWPEVWPHFFNDPSISAFAAHNAAFDGKFITDDMLKGRPLICTYKAALRVWPDAPKHSNQVLRYWLGLQIFENCSPPHRAVPDAVVTAHILRELLKYASLDDMIKWSIEPALLPKIMFGKHAGAKWSDVPEDYLNWILGVDDMEADVKWNAGIEIKRRKTDGYVGAALEEIAKVESREDLVNWFRNEAGKRAEVGIGQGHPGYDRIVAACAERKAQLPETPQVAA